MTLRGAVLLLVLFSTAARADNVSEALTVLDRGVALYKAGDLPAARAEFVAAHNLVPDKPNPFRWLGLVDARLGRCKDAVDELTHFLQLISADDPRAVEAIAVRDACKSELAAAAHSSSSEDELAARVRREVEASERERHLREEAAEKAAREAALARAAADAAARRTVETSPEYQRQRITTCPHGHNWVFCDARGSLTENEFLRRYGALTGDHSFDGYLGNRRKKELAAMGALNVIGLATTATGIYFLAVGPTGGCAPGTMNCMNKGEVDFGRNESIGLAVSVSGVAVTAGFLIGFGLTPDGWKVDHRLSMAQGQAAVERYDRALVDKLLPK